VRPNDFWRRIEVAERYAMLVRLCLLQVQLVVETPSPYL
jgi:hypothetical protein